MVKNKLLIMSFVGLFMISASALACEDPCESKRARMKRPDFASLDLNNDSYISLDEFKQHDIPHGEHQVIFSEMDIDNDELINRTEYDSHKPAHPPKHKHDH